MIVLDTNALVWSLLDRRKLSRGAASAMSRERDIRIPTICFWELAMLATHEKVPVRRSDVPSLLDAALADARVTVAELTPEIGYRASGLFLNGPMDPADQLVAATALVLGARLVTSDERLHGLPGLQILW